MVARDERRSGAKLDFSLNPSSSTQNVHQHVAIENLKKGLFSLRQCGRAHVGLVADHQVDDDHLG